MMVESAKYPYRFSLQFRFQMWRLLNGFVRDGSEERTGPSPVKRYIPLRRAAIVFFAILLSIVGFCASVIGVQNAYRMVEEIFEKYSSVRYENPVSEEHGEFVLYEIARLPDGFVLDEEDSYCNTKSGQASTTYRKEDDYIILEQDYVDNYQWDFNTEDTSLVSMVIGSKEGSYYANKNVEHFFWIEGEYGLLIFTTLDKNELSSLVQETKIVDK